MKKYRVESGKLFKYDSDAKAYIFCAELNGKTKKQAINYMEELEDHLRDAACEYEY